MHILSKESILLIQFAYFYLIQPYIYNISLKFFGIIINWLFDKYKQLSIRHPEELSLKLETRTLTPDDMKILKKVNNPVLSSGWPSILALLIEDMLIISWLNTLIPRKSVKNSVISKRVQRFSANGQKLIQTVRQAVIINNYKAVSGKQLTISNVWIVWPLGPIWGGRNCYDGPDSLSRTTAYCPNQKDMHMGYVREPAVRRVPE